MLNKIVIRNILSHKKTIIKLVDGVNVITGITDSGKSAIFAAIYWVLYNRPSADGIRSNWDHDIASVKLYFSDGKIERRKSGKQNVYIINNGTPLLAGRTVPEPVKEFLNCSTINFQSQFESPFMLGWNPAERGAFLNEITNLQIIDTTISNIKKTIREENNLIGNYQTQLEEYNGQIKEYKGLNDLDEAVTALEKKQAKIDRLENRQYELIDFVEKIDMLDRSIKKTSRVLKIKKHVQRLDTMLSKYKKKKKACTELEQLIESIKRCDAGIKNQKYIIEKNKKEFKRLMPKTCPLCKRIM